MYQSVQNQINTNITKTYLIIAIFISLITGVGYLISQATGAGLNGMFATLGFSLFMTFISYTMGDKMVLAMHGAKEVQKNDYPEFFEITNNLAKKAFLPMPKLYVIESQATNAFATGKGPESGIVCVTTGILQKLNREELSGVIAHELGHIKNYDIRLMTITSLLVGLLGSLINYFHYSSMFSSRDNNREDRNPIFGIIGMALIIFAPIVGTLLQLAISRSREFMADATAVDLTKNPDGLISALKKISDSHTQFSQANTATASLYISNPFSKNTFGSLFSTHPPIEERIKALEKLKS